MSGWDQQDTDRSSKAVDRTLTIPQGRAPATKIKAYKNVRSFYAANMVTLPKAKLKLGDNNQVRVKVETTATDFLLMVRKALNAASIRDHSDSSVDRMVSHHENMPGSRRGRWRIIAFDCIQTLESSVNVKSGKKYRKPFRGATF